MQGDPQVIQWLQAQLKNELTAINQYFVHYRMFVIVRPAPSLQVD